MRPSLRKAFRQFAQRKTLLLEKRGEEVHPAGDLVDVFSDLWRVV
jgi:hypothetical protein